MGTRGSLAAGPLGTGGGTAHSGDGGDSLLPLATLRTLSSFLAGDKRGYFRLTINHNRARSAVSRELLVEGRYPEVTKVWLLPHYSGYYCCQAAVARQGEASVRCCPVTLQIVLLPSWAGAGECGCSVSGLVISFKLAPWSPGRQPGHSGP